jgi:hypothetical protein
MSTLMLVYLASPVLANNAIPLVGLRELFTGTALSLVLVPAALALTFFPRLSPTQPPFQTLLAAMTASASGLIFGLTLRLMSFEFRPESYREYWTGVYFLLPFTLSLCALAVVVARRTPNAAVRHLVLAWFVPIGIWMVVSGLLFVIGTLPTYL